MKVTKIIVAPHVHWDREWYFSCEESQLLAVRDFGEILDHLEQDPTYPSFVLDGQMAVVDEYVRTVPGSADRIRRLVNDGRLHLGPWFTQTDQMVVGGESMVRNLLYGIESANALGGPMLIGYVPDSFGQSAQTPMILNQFGIYRYVFWRGQSQFSGTTSNQFVWESKDGSQVLAYRMAQGYAIGKYLQTDPQELRNRLESLFAVLDKISPTPYAILPNGHDQMPIQTNIEEVLQGLRKAFPDRDFVLGSFDDVLDLIEKSPQRSSLPTVRGDLIDGKDERVHRSIYSVRSDNKVANTRCENLLTKQVEPLVAVASDLGIDCPRALLDTAWKQLLENHAHDSMGGCCSDKVNAQIASRAANSLERAGVLESYYQRFIAESVDLGKEDKLVLFNMHDEPGTRLITADVLTQSNNFELYDASGNKVPYGIAKVEEVDPGLVDRQIVAAGNYKPFLKTTIELRRDIPTVGYEALCVHETDGERPASPQVGAQTEFKTSCYAVRTNRNGTLDVQTEAGTIYRGLFGLELEANDGDEYDFSPLPGGRVIHSADTVDCTPTIVETPESVRVELSYSLDLPSTAEQWITEGAVGSTDSLGVDLVATFDKESPTIALDVTLDNQANDFRARLLVPTGIAAQVSYAGDQFGTIERPVVDPALAVWEREGWAERPDTIYPFNDYVALATKKRTAMVLTNGPREYQVVGKDHDELAITLLSCTGVLGKPNLVRRPGRPSGISVPTPDAECHGELSLQLAVAFLDEPLDDAGPAGLASQWLTPVTSYQCFAYVPIRLSKPTPTLPARYSLLEQDNSKLTLSAVKRSQDGAGIIARFYNAGSTNQRLELRGAEVQEYLTLGEVPTQGDGLVAPNSTVTVRIR